MTKDRFDLEQAIMNCWLITDDLQLVIEAIVDKKYEMTDDEIANLLIGLKQLYQVKFERTLDTFGEVMEKRHAG
jgi:transcription initiation factor IIE alpha subunit